MEIVSRSTGILISISSYRFSAKMPWELKPILPKGNIVVHWSNYDKRYYCLQYKLPSSSSGDPKEHSFEPDDLRVAVVASPLAKKK